MPGQPSAWERKQRLSDALRFMAKEVPVRDKIPGDAAYAHGLDPLDVGFGRLGPFGGVARLNG